MKQQLKREEKIKDSKQYRQIRNRKDRRKATAELKFYARNKGK